MAKKWNDVHPKAPSLFHKVNLEETNTEGLWHKQKLQESKFYFVQLSPSLPTLIHTNLPFWHNKVSMASLMRIPAAVLSQNSSWNSRELFSFVLVEHFSLLWKPEIISVPQSWRKVFVRRQLHFAELTVTSPWGKGQLKQDGSRC